MDHFETAEEFIGPLTDSIRPHLSEDTHLLFSYHGLPVSHVKRIDASSNHCQKVKTAAQCARPTDCATDATAMKRPWRWLNGSD